MKLYVTRDSVAAGDDMDAPHSLELPGPSVQDVGAAIRKVLATGYLPLISGGKATWSVHSKKPLAVIAQEWRVPKLLWSGGYDELDAKGGTLRLHFTYHAQHDPAAILEALRLGRSFR